MMVGNLATYIRAAGKTRLNFLETEFPASKKWHFRLQIFRKTLFSSFINNVLLHQGAEDQFKLVHQADSWQDTASAQ